MEQISRPWKISDAVTLAEAAHYLGLAKPTLRQQIRNGKLKAYKFGRDWVIEAHEVERYALENRRTPIGK
jgi:excisionase family DNA binding protein